MSDTKECLDSSVRTLAIVVARCHRAAAPVRPPRGAEGRLGLAREPECSATAEVLHRQLELLVDLAPQRVLVIEADAMRGIDYAALVDAHAAAGVGATLAFAEIAAEADYRRAGVTVDARGRVLRVGEAPPHGGAHEGRGRFVCAGAYVFDRELLVDCLEVDAAEPTSAHDFRDDVLPVVMRANGIAAHRVLAAGHPPVGPPQRRRQASLDTP